MVRAQKLSSMSLQTFAATYGQIFRVIPNVPGSADESARMIWDLHRRHGNEVTSVVDAQLARERLADLPSNSLLAMIASPIAAQPSYVDPVELERSAASQAAVDQHEYKLTPVYFGVDATKRRIILEQGIELSGSEYALFMALLKQFDNDRSAGLLPDKYRFTQAGKLSDALQIEPPSLRKRFSRLRKKMENTFRQPRRHVMMDDLIQNRQWKGYRLNPFLIPVSPSELRSETGKRSQLEAEDVTSHAGRH